MVVDCGVHDRGLGSVYVSTYVQQQILLFQLGFIFCLLLIGLRVRLLLHALFLKPLAAVIKTCRMRDSLHHILNDGGGSQFDYLRLTSSTNVLVQPINYRCKYQTVWKPVGRSL